MWNINILYLKHSCVWLHFFVRSVKFSGDDELYFHREGKHHNLLNAEHERESHQDLMRNFSTPGRRKRSVDWCRCQFRMIVNLLFLAPVWRQCRCDSSTVKLLYIYTQTLRRFTKRVQKLRKTLLFWKVCNLTSVFSPNWSPVDVQFLLNADVIWGNIWDVHVVPTSCRGKEGLLLWKRNHLSRSECQEDDLFVCPVGGKKFLLLLELSVDFDSWTPERRVFCILVVLDSFCSAIFRVFFPPRLVNQVDYCFGENTIHGLDVRDSALVFLWPSDQFWIMMWCC